MLNKQWNVVASLTVIVLLSYGGVVVYALVADKIDFAGFQSAVAPMLAAVTGYMARMLGEQKE